jgi:6-phosphogluconolactonase
MLPIQRDGSLGPATDVVQHSGSSIDPKRQTAPFVHCIRPGSGPRHLIFHPNRRYMYLINERNSTLIVYRYRTDSGNSEEVQTISTSPQDYKDINLCADLHIYGNYLYVSTRGHDSIVLFHIDENTGQLTYEDYVYSGGTNRVGLPFTQLGTSYWLRIRDLITLSAFRSTQQPASC